MARRNRGGRKKKQGVARYESGQIIRGAEYNIPPEALQRRAELVGMNVGDKMLTKVDASSALGRLVIIGILKRHHYDAGLRLASADRNWSRAIEAGTRHARVADYGAVVRGPSSEPPEWEAARVRFTKVKESVLPGLHWSIVESVVMDDVIPPYALTECEHGRKIKAATIAAFDQLAKYYGLTEG